MTTFIRILRGGGDLVLQCVGEQDPEAAAKLLSNYIPYTIVTETQSGQRLGMYYSGVEVR